MTVGELITALSNYPVDTPVIVSSDEEGNSFALLCDIEESLYDPNQSPYYIEQVYLTHEQLDAALAENKKWYSEEDRAPEGSVLAVVLWP